ncbi:MULTISPECIES: hypothetical protein [unclassified Modestobacter]|uniref:hypothetical protein n=1 Tax=unclassified Modestobacter TaxID=2643866 RepID=UPI0022AB446F|nr:MULTISPECIES: hypothetical protein [unclassified Modestobacter]MCZ2822802.1 hypothetical protein [Modestobacter sp. VKM Ac-2981]MCZ2851048.1 hypothetical protein [Modestobacter sp. VKM Ac-2982]
MSIHAAAEHLAIDVQAIEEMATAVLASIARIHTDGLAAVATIAENPASVRMPLPEAAAPVAEPVRAVEPQATETPAAESEPEPEPEPVQVIRAAPPLPPRGRHLAEALTDQLPVQHAA